MLLSVVVPVFNEQNNLPLFIAALQKHVPADRYQLEVVLIDDGSTDGTWVTITQLAKEHKICRGLRFSRNFGKEHALAAGIDYAKGDLVLIMDADLQHPPELIPTFLERYEQGDVDLVEATKRDRGKESFFKRLGVGIFQRLFKFLSGVDLKNASDYKLLSRRALDALKILPERTPFFRGLSVWIGFPRASILFDVTARSQGKSGWSYMRLLRLGFSSITSFSSAPLHLVTLVAAVFGFFALVLGAQTLYRYFSGSSLSGFSTVILVALIASCVTLFGLSILGVYVARIYDEVKCRPRYIFQDAINIGVESSSPDRNQDINRSLQSGCNPKKFV